MSSRPDSYEVKGYEEEQRHSLRVHLLGTRYDNQVRQMQHAAASMHLTGLLQQHSEWPAVLDCAAHRLQVLTAAPGHMINPC